jgi:polyhydroxyalkanoate synthesis regulator phasin
VSDVLDALRGYVQLATGLTEVTVTRAREAAGALLAQGMDLASQTREVPGGDSAKYAAAQVQDLADDLLETSKQNREMLVGLVRTEVDRAAGRMGFVREEELAAVRRHVSRLETQLADIRSAMGAAGVAASEKAAADRAADHDPTHVAAAAAPSDSPTPVAKPVKKKVPVAKPVAPVVADPS